MGAIDTFEGRGQGDAGFVMQLDRDLRHVHISDDALELLGVPAEGLLGRTPREANLPVEALDRWESALREVIASRAERRVELQMGTAQGPRWLQNRIIPRLEPGGDVGGVTVLGKDITARRHAELTLSGGNAAFRALVEDAPDPIARFDRELRYVYVNRALERLVGLPAGDLLGLAISEVGPERPEIAARWEHAVRAVFATGEGATLDFRAVTAEGPRWFSARLVPEPEAGGAVGHVIVACTDVTDRVNREAEQASLRRVATAVAREGDLSEISRVVAQETALLLGATGSAVYRLEAHDLATCVAAHPPTTDGAAVPWTLTLGGRTATATVARTGRPARVDDYLVPDADDSARQALESGLRSGIAAPLWNRGRLWGILAAASAKPHAFGPAADRRLAAFAELAAIAVGNAETRAELARLADTDSLTGLANRRAFTARLTGEVQRARRHGHPLALAIIDLDDFKAINDTHGHQAGDLLLQETGRRLAANCRAGELVARIGGEEFAWILPQVDAEGGRVAAERARAAISRIELEDIRSVTCSAGVSDLRRSRRGGEDLLRDADRALYRAKRAGRDRVEVAPAG